MADPTNAQLADIFLEELQSSGFDIFTEDHRNVTGPVQRFLYILPLGEIGDLTSPQEMRERVRLWLVAKGVTKTDKQVNNITRAIVSNVPHRGPNLKH
jgi:hypothetical protein